METKFGDLIKNYRRRALMTQEQLAKNAGLKDHSYISRVENRDLPPPTVVRAILKALNSELNFRWGELQELAVSYLLPSEMRVDRGDSAVIGLIVPRVDRSSFWSRVVGAIENEAIEAGYKIVLCQHDEDITRELDHLDFFQDSLAVAGIILAPAVGIVKPSRRQRADVETVLATLRKRGTPVVLIDRVVPTLQHIPFVGLDNLGASRKGVEHLINAGHTRIGALLALPQSSVQQERLEGYKQALIDYNLSYDERLVKFGEEVSRNDREADRQRYGIRRGRRNAHELLRLPENERPTAIFCSTYYMALEALHAKRDLEGRGTSFAVPEHISVIAFDDVPELDVAFPQITRVQYPIVELAAHAVNKILALIDNPNDQKALRDVRINSAQIAEKGSVVSRKKA